MWIYDPDRSCRECRSSDYPFFARAITAKKISIHSICLLCKRENENLRMMMKWKEYKKRATAYHKKWIAKNRKKYNAYMRAYYKKKNRRHMYEVDNFVMNERIY